LGILNRTVAGAGALLATGTLVAGCGSGSSREDPEGAAVSVIAGQGAGSGGRAGGEGAVAYISLTSPAFASGQPLAAPYGCAGVSPPLRWSGVPRRTSELFLMVVDLDGQGAQAVRWTVAHIPPRAGGLPAGRLPAGAVLGRTAGGGRWSGVCGGHAPGHLAFLLYALRERLPLRSGFDPAQARARLGRATLGGGVLVATGS
jgi:phosphatidylethanolamine-binding protein (PEBP) family uncharacterized protein